MEKIVAESKFRHNEDLRAEVFLVEILASLRELDDVAIRPMGAFNRGYQRDIIKINEEQSGLNPPKTVVETSRGGLYDFLPTGLFHRVDTKLSSQKRKRSREEVLKIIRQRQQQELDARKFFRPFDEAFYWYRILAEWEERKIESGLVDSFQADVFDAIWGNYDNLITAAQKKMLLYLVPLAHHIVGNPRLTALCFQAGLHARVELHRGYQAGRDEVQGYVPGLNDCCLGVDTILGRVSEELELHYQFTIGPIEKERAAFFLPGMPGQKIIEVLCGFFVPMEANVSYAFSMECDQIVFPEVEAPEGISETDNLLGYTTQL